MLMMTLAIDTLPTEFTEYPCTLPTVLVGILRGSEDR